MVCLTKKEDMNKKRNFKKRWSKQDFICKGKPLGVSIPAPEAFEKGLRMWKKQVKEAGVIQELKDKREYVKPSAKRRKQKADAIRKQQYRTAIENRYWDKHCWAVLTKDMTSGPTLPTSLQ